MIQAWGEHPLPRPHMLFIKIFWDYFLSPLYLTNWSMLKTRGSVDTNLFVIIALELLLRTCNLGKGYSPPALVSLGFSEQEQGSSAFVFLRGRCSQHCCLHLTSHRIDCTAPSMRVLYALHIVYFLLVKKDNKKGKAWMTHWHNSGRTCKALVDIHAVWGVKPAEFAHFPTTANVNP